MRLKIDDLSVKELYEEIGEKVGDKHDWGFGGLPDFDGYWDCKEWFEENFPEWNPRDFREKKTDTSVLYRPELSDNFDFNGDAVHAVYFRLGRREFRLTTPYDSWDNGHDTTFSLYSLEWVEPKEVTQIVYESKGRVYG